MSKSAVVEKLKMIKSQLETTLDGREYWTDQEVGEMEESIDDLNDAIIELETPCTCPTK